MTTNACGPGAMLTLGDSEREEAGAWFAEIGKRLCCAFESLESRLAEATGDTGQGGRFVAVPTRRRSATDDDAGGGTMHRLRDGVVFEKASVNISTVHGKLSEGLARLLATRMAAGGLTDDTMFWASGVSMVAHLQNPMAPAGHFNTRMFDTPVGWWFGGSADLNPCIPFDDDRCEFHAALEQVCDSYDTGCYSRFSEWADRYFHIPHRNRARGIGGIFFDDLCSGDWRRDLEFVSAVGTAFLDTYCRLLERRCRQGWTQDDRRTQLLHRGLYVEFNLLYDRGTRFGLESGHDADAVLMSMPPVATWL